MYFRITLLISAFLLAGAHSTAQGEGPRRVIAARTKRVDVPQELMNEIYRTVKTPFKYGSAALTRSDGCFWNIRNYGAWV